MSPVPLPVLPLVDLLARLGEQGECRYDPDLHTGPDVFEVEPIAERRARVDAAKDVCESCPVALECLEYALRANPAHGVWAGYTPRGLAALRTQVRAEVPAEVA
ncbi:WhiB family transcriptional regulator [Actinocorallia aurantiaca]|uniref:Transcriptional regulator WhiB n=1 Tax=Actinocorallia aurantiaca TaxID=46204 RepID=A0ABN3UNR2_9ACTN